MEFCFLLNKGEKQGLLGLCAGLWFGAVGGIDVNNGSIQQCLNNEVPFILR